MNRITKEFYNRLRGLMLPCHVPMFVEWPYKYSSHVRAISDIKFECRVLAQRWTIASYEYKVGDYSKNTRRSHDNDKVSIHRNLTIIKKHVHTGRVIIVNGTPVPEIVEKEVTVFRISLDDKFRQQAERRIEQIKAKTARFLQMEVYGFMPENKVYFIKDTNAGHIKIGVSHNPDRRRQTLEANRGTALMLLGTIDGGYKKEKELHRRFNHLRIFGEWFQDCPELRQAIQAMRR
jgi:hypothetical protein